MATKHLRMEPSTPLHRLPPTLLQLPPPTRLRLLALILHQGHQLARTPLRLAPTQSPTVACLTLQGQCQAPHHHLTLGLMVECPCQGLRATGSQLLVSESGVLNTREADLAHDLKQPCTLNHP